MFWCLRGYCTKHLIELLTLDKHSQFCSWIFRRTDDHWICRYVMATKNKTGRSVWTRLGHSQYNFRQYKSITLASISPKLKQKAQPKPRYGSVISYTVESYTVSDPTCQNLPDSFEHNPLLIRFRPALENAIPRSADTWKFRTCSCRWIAILWGE